MKRTVITLCIAAVLIAVGVGLWSGNHDPNEPTDEEKVFVEQLQEIHRKMEVADGAEMDKLYKEKIKVLKAYRAMMRERSARSRSIFAFYWQRRRFSGGLRWIWVTTSIT